MSIESFSAGRKVEPALDDPGDDRSVVPGLPFGSGAIQDEDAGRVVGHSGLDRVEDVSEDLVQAQRGTDPAREDKSRSYRLSAVRVSNRGRAMESRGHQWPLA
jgi:hypothetical protein